MNNDGIHAPGSASGSVNIPEAGTYPISFTFFEKDGGEQMQVYWTGPGIARQLIPDNAFNLSDPGDYIPPSMVNDLHVAAKAGNFISLDWSNATDNTGVTEYDVYMGNNFSNLKYTTKESQITIGGLLPGTIYNFYVKARDAARNTSAAGNIISESTSSLANGLAFRYYEGNFTELPDFTALTAAKTGVTPNLDISVRPSILNDHFAFIWEGYINIPVAGDYTFETSSDDGSKLYFNSRYIPAALPTINNDGVHAPYSVSGTVHVATPGSYPITITYFEKEVGEQLQVYWTGPGMERQLIPASAFVQTVPTPPGLTYKYYEGNWDKLPDFSKLAPVSNGRTPNVDIGVRRAGVNDHFAFVWEGSINITQGGIYDFETLSDDGSSIYFNSTYSPSAPLLVLNDGEHAPTSSSGEIFIRDPGAYPITITYFEKEGDEQMQVKWGKPGFPTQLIPDSAFDQTHDYIPPTVPHNIRALYTGKGFVHVDWEEATDNVAMAGYEVSVYNKSGIYLKKYSCVESAFTVETLQPNTTYDIFVRAVDRAGNYSDVVEYFDFHVTATTTGAANGLNYRYYDGNWDSLPNFNTLTPVKTGLSPNVDISVQNAGTNNHFAFVWEGYINIPRPGSYSFETISDDGSKLYFGSFYIPGATPLVNNDGVHAPYPAVGNLYIALAGLYPISITFFEKEGGEQMQLFWSGPGIDRQPVPNAAFMEPAPSIAPALNKAGAVEEKDKLASLTRIYPNPFTDWFNIAFYNTSSANNISITVNDMKGRKVFEHHAGSLPAGNNTVAIPLSAAQISESVYTVTLKINGVASKTMLLLKSKQ